MLVIPAPLQAALDQEVTSLAVCWRIECIGQNAPQFFGTQHDRDIVVSSNSTILDLTGTYYAQIAISGSDVRSSSDISVDNLEVNGAFDPELFAISDVTADDVELGVFDDALVTLFLVDWEAPDDGQIILRTGTMGEITRDSDGRYRTELRGLTQRLSQVTVRTYGASCDATFGDARCKHVIVPGEETYGVVDSVSSNRVFAATLQDVHTAGYYNGGRLLWLDGNNVGRSMEVKRDDDGSSPPSMELCMSMPRPIQVGDSFYLWPGCDKSPASCKTKWNNFANFRGHGMWVPGAMHMMSVGTPTQKKKKKKKKKNIFDAIGRGWS